MYVTGLFLDDDVLSGGRVQEQREPVEATKVDAEQRQPVEATKVDADSASSPKDPQTAASVWSARYRLLIGELVLMCVWMTSQLNVTILPSTGFCSLYGLAFIFTASPLGSILGNLAAGAAVKRYGAVSTICLALGLVVFGLVAFAIVPSLHMGTSGVLVVFVSFAFVTGAGLGLAESAILPILLQTLPGHVGKLLSLNEIVGGLGHAVGPLVGGVLFDAGASFSAQLHFALPFLVMAVVLVLLLVTLYRTVPKLISPTASASANSALLGPSPDLSLPPDLPSPSLSELSPSANSALLSPLPDLPSPSLSERFPSSQPTTLCSILYAHAEIFFVLMMVAAASTVFNSLVLTLPLRLEAEPFNASPTEVGLVFLVQGIAYSLLSFPLGYLLDHYPNPSMFRFMTCMGTILLVLSLWLLGPAPWLLINRLLSFRGVELQAALNGAGTICVLLTSLVTMLAKFPKPHSESLQAALNGSWCMALQIGRMVGPPLGAFLAMRTEGRERVCVQDGIPEFCFGGAMTVMSFICLAALAFLVVADFSTDSSRCFSLACASYRNFVVHKNSTMESCVTTSSGSGISHRIESISCGAFALETVADSLDVTRKALPSIEEAPEAYM
eukprot:g7025.t1